MKRGLLAAALAAGCALLTCGSALADPPTSESLTLDTYSAANNGAAGPVSSVGTLAANTLYVVTVQGTWSAWAPDLWTGTGFGIPAVVCGTPEAAPMFPSPVGNQTGPVGEDAEVIFAGVERPGCPLTPPKEYTGFQMNLGSGFMHYEPYTGATNTPSPNHSYTYIVAGKGSPISFEQVDYPTSDNYGEYQITVTLGTATCKKGGWQAYGVFKNQGDCVSYFATDGRNPPALLSSTATFSLDQPGI
jgi:hypothetical protein